MNTIPVIYCAACFYILGMNFSFGRRQEKIDWRRLGKKLHWLKKIDCIISICLDENVNINLKGFASVLVISFTIFTLELKSWQQKVNLTVVC